MLGATPLAKNFVIFSFAFIARPFGTALFMAAQRRWGRGTKLTASLFLLGNVAIFLPIMLYTSSLFLAALFNLQIPLIVIAAAMAVAAIAGVTASLRKRSALNVTSA